MEVESRESRLDVHERGAPVASRNRPRLVTALEKVVLRTSRSCSNCHVTADSLLIASQPNYIVRSEIWHYQQEWNSRILRLSNICMNVILYYLTQCIKSMGPEEKPHARKSKTVRTTHNHLRCSVMSQPDPGTGNHERPWNCHQCHQGAG